MLIIVSGPDRVGKSTLISHMADVIGEEDVMISHHSAPPKDQDSIFDFYKQDITKWIDSGKPHCIFDRAWPCSYILEQFRRSNLGHLEDLIDLELWINDTVADGVVHLAQLRPWFWSAPLHVEELKEEAEHNTSSWYIRDQYITRMQEHEIYQTQLIDFYEKVTMFPHVQLTETVTPETVIELCQEAVLAAGR